MPGPTIKDIEINLNTLYSRNDSSYAERLDLVKTLGYRVLRNSQGLHKIEIRNDGIKNFFNGIFGGNYE